MSYNSIALMADDNDLRLRIKACVSKEGDRDGQAWVTQNMWLLAATPGWDDAWDSALQVGIGRPGYMPNVISDNMILAAVQALKLSQQPPVSPPEVTA